MSRDFVKPVTAAELDSASNSKSVTLIVTSRDRPSHSRGASGTAAADILLPPAARRRPD